MYVNLESCMHEDKKTPPCVPAIIASGIWRVVVGMKDPNPRVAGRGIRALRQAGIRVDVGALGGGCRALNEAYAKWITTGRPFVLLKVAVTLDGALTFRKGTRSDFSSPKSYAYVHELRQMYDAIALGSESVLTDDPLLTTRRKNKQSRNPVRVIFDRRLRIPKQATLLKQPGETIIFSKKFGDIPGATVVNIPSLSSALAWLGKRGITSVMVEGGAELARSFLRQGLADKFMLTVTPHLASDPQAPRLFDESFPLQFTDARWEIRGADAWFSAYPAKKET